LNNVYALLRESGYTWSIESDFIRADSFSSVKVRKDSDVLLKLDFVNDKVPMFGEITKTELFYRTDSVRNILSNKLSAIYRFAAKDIVDIKEIALHEENINWSQIINEAKHKEEGLELIYISEILTGMPQTEFETIAWTKKPSWEEFREDIDRIVFDMISGR